MTKFNELVSVLKFLFLRVMLLVLMQIHLNCLSKRNDFRVQLVWSTEPESPTEGPEFCLSKGPQEILMFRWFRSQHFWHSHLSVSDQRMLGSPTPWTLHVLPLISTLALVLHPCGPEPVLVPSPAGLISASCSMSGSVWAVLRTHQGPSAIKLSLILVVNPYQFNLFFRMSLPLFENTALKE